MTSYLIIKHILKKSLSSNRSKKREVIISIVIIISIIGGTEAAANVWWYEINHCAFENSDIFKDLDEETKRKLCLESHNLQFTETRISPQEGKLVNINSDGFRGDKISKEKPNNIYRIFVVGASVILGMGVFDDQTIPSYLEKLYNDANLGFDVEVINAGINFAWSESETKTIKERLLDYDPDLIIVYDVYNDLVRQADILQVYKGETTNANDWKNRWIEICDLGKQENFDTIITIQPFLGSGYRILTDQEYELFIQHKNFLVGGYLPLISSYVDQLQELNKHCTATADFTKIFDEYAEPIYFDIVHSGPRGNQIVAQNMFDISLPIVIANTEKVNLDGSIGSPIVDNVKNAPDDRFDLNSFYKTPKVIAYFLSGGSDNKNNQVVPDKKNFDGMNLSEENFEGADLSGATFIDADLTDTNFRDADLSNTDFRFAKMNNVDLRNANLRDANFPRVNFFNVDFRNADFTNAYLSGANFQQSIGMNSNFKNAYLVSTTFQFVNLTSTNLEGADFKNTLMQLVDMRASDISNTSFKDSELLHVFFNDVNFDNVDLSYADLVGSSFQNAKLSNVNLENTDLSGKIIINPDGSQYAIAGADFSYVDFSGIVLQKNILFRTAISDLSSDDENFPKQYAPKFIEVNLSNLDLSELDMSYVDFSNAKFVNSNLSNALLIHSDLSNADLTNANLENANLKNANLDGAILDCINHPICN